MIEKVGEFLLVRGCKGSLAPLREVLQDTHDKCLHGKEFPSKPIHKIRIVPSQSLSKNDFEGLPRLSQENVEEKRKQLLDDKTARFGLLVERNFQKLKFIRPREKPNTFTFDRGKEHPRERVQSAYNLINALSYSPEPYNESLLTLFEVRELVNRFYKEYRAVRDKLAGQIRGGQNGANELFAQVLLDRFIFIYFLQSRGILPEHCLLTLFQQAQEQKRNYYDLSLKPLFFELLNSNDKGVRRKYENEFGRFVHDIPYLNGGLFRRREFEENGIEIPNDAWNPVFELFEGYEWVVEDTESGGLTPEILGHIFEMSMNTWQRKLSASYYTPMEVTRLMCEHAITKCAFAGLNRKFGTRFSSMQDVTSPEQIRFLLQNISKLKILDPAVGSGAFLVAAEGILFDFILQLNDKLQVVDPDFVRQLLRIDPNDSMEYCIRKWVVTRNLYGVDINPEAAEICRLRLWLSMVAKATKIEPLPNIEFNIRSGNSLLGFVHPDSDVGMDSRLDDLKSIRQKMNERAALISKFKDAPDSKSAGILNTEINSLTKKFNADLDKKVVALLRKVGYTERIFSEPAVSKPFHWIMEFYDIMNEGGFDVIVTNPPFTRSEKLHLLRDILPHLMRDKSKYFKQSTGLHCYFIFQADSLLKDDGVLSAVLPAATFGADYANPIALVLLPRSRPASQFLPHMKAST